MVLLYLYFIAKVLCCFGIRTEEIQLTALKNFQVSKALVVAAEKIRIPLNVPNHRLRLEVCICLTVDEIFLWTTSRGGR